MAPLKNLADHIIRIESDSVEIIGFTVQNGQGGVEQAQPEKRGRPQQGALVREG